MKMFSLILRIVAIVAGIAAVVLYFNVEGKLGEKQIDLEKSEEALVQARSELEAANEKVTSLEGTLEKERDALAESKRSLESVRSEMYTAKQELTRTQEQLKESKAKVEDLDQSAARLRSDLLKAQEAAAEASGEEKIAALEERVEQLQQANTELKEKIDAAEERAERARRAASAAQPPAGATPEGPESAGPAEIGTEITLASVNPEAGIVVFRARPDFKVSAGVRFKMIHGNQPLGQVEVTRTTPEFIVANILPGSNARAMPEGATVKVIR